MAGDKSIGENYAFAGMHHIFDQHQSAGRRGYPKIMFYFIFSIIHIFLYFKSSTKNSKRYSVSIFV